MCGAIILKPGAKNFDDDAGIIKPVFVTIKSKLEGSTVFGLMLITFGLLLMIFLLQLL